MDVPPGDRAAQARDPRVGQCSSCRFAQRQTSTRGQTFWRCQRAGEDPALPRYPSLPVQNCPAFQPAASPAV